MANSNKTTAPQEVNFASKQDFDLRDLHTLKSINMKSHRAYLVLRIKVLVQDSPGDDGAGHVVGCL